MSGYGSGTKAFIQTVVSPGVTDDETKGYAIGWRWINTATDNEFVCLDAAEGAAVWSDTTNAGELPGAHASTHEHSGADVVKVPGLKDIYVADGVIAIGDCVDLGIAGVAVATAATTLRVLGVALTTGIDGFVVVQTAGDVDATAVAGNYTAGDRLYLASESSGATKVVPAWPSPVVVVGYVKVSEVLGSAGLLSVSLAQEQVIK